MKKILLLFVLFLGLNVGAFAANEIEPVEFRSLPEGILLTGLSMILKMVKGLLLMTGHTV